MSYHSPRCGIFPISPGTYIEPAKVSNEYPLVKAACHYTVVDVNVHARLTQTYVSQVKVAQDVKYVFPLPSNAAVCAFSAVIDDKRTIHGVVKQKDEAKRTYDEAVAAGKTAGLLDQHTADVFQVSLGNLKPGQKIAVNISYISIVSHEGKLDTLRLTFPTSIAPNYGAPPPSLEKSLRSLRGTSASLELTVSFSMSSNITSVTSQTHPIALSLGTLMPDAGTAFDPTKAHVSLSTSKLDKDIVVVVKADKLDHPRCVVERASRQDEVSDAIALTLVPRFNVPPIPEQEYIFLIDRSGSMGGGRISAVRTALQIMLRSLPSRGTTFNLFSFGSHCDSLWPTSVEYGSDSVQQAAAYVDTIQADYGGTEIRAALAAAFSSRSAAKRTSPATVLLLTDGEAWDLEGVLKETTDAVKASNNALRVFVLGVGDQVSTNMCDAIARSGRGIAAYVGEQEKPDAKLMTMLKAARGGAVEDLTVDWGVPEEVSESEQNDDFEVVEAVNTQPTSSPPAAPISLFETAPAEPAQNVSLGPENIPVNLPPVPRIQQTTTSKLGMLYPGFRTSLFAIVKQPTPSAALPEKLTIRGKVMGNPVQLELPITRATPAPARDGESIIDFVHVLAARAFVQELEDETNKTALVKAQIVRLATTYGITSSQTSFVAVDEHGDTTPASVKEEDPSAGGGKKKKKVNLTGGLFGAPRAMMRMASGGSRTGSAIPPPPPPVAPAPLMAMAPPPPGSAANPSRSFASIRSVASKAPPPPSARGQSSVAFSLAPAAMSRTRALSQDDDDDSVSDDGGTPMGASRAFGSAYGAASPSASKAAPIPTGPPTIETFARQQQFDGSFPPSDVFYSLFGSKSSEAKSAKPASVTNETIWSTVLAIAYLQKNFADDEDAWTLLVEKAKDYIVQILLAEGADEDSAGNIVDGWLRVAKGVVA
ncbi:VIT-domain-containing protein [Exidia glandulosa HHB12029]|uniref:VIT-domain-containing protein n=1 Tax=Exidia glandulosa HHB12029 TaxID=1314781 RepID=A0A165R360_EXIGL|nr:VIT-domain-containing protein [Exidia glandulosa HHB12029]